jgi:methylisocitrate lyase
MASPFLEAAAGRLPVQVVGVTNAYVAMLAERAGFPALYLSGSGVATAAFGLPDLGLTTLTEVAEETRRITAASALPLLVDADTGWGGPLMVERTGRELARAGAAAIQLEDQVLEKRCGHRPNKRLVAEATMVSRIDAARQGGGDALAVVARTDALARGGVEEAVQRSKAYATAGANVLFLEAATSIEEYAAVSAVVDLPVLANLTEFGVTPAFTLDDLGAAGVRYVLYPLTVFRSMSAAAVRTLELLRADRQASALASMQTRAELYEVLDYDRWERRADADAALDDGGGE